MASIASPLRTAIWPTMRPAAHAAVTVESQLRITIQAASRAIAVSDCIVGALRPLWLYPLTRTGRHWQLPPGKRSKPGGGDACPPGASFARVYTPVPRSVADTIDGNGSGPKVSSSKQNALFRRLAAELPALLRRRPKQAKPQTQRKAQRRLTPEQVAQLVREYEAGDDIRALAARWGLHRTTVAAHLGRAGVGSGGKACQPIGWTRPSGCTAKAGPCSGLLSAPAVTMRRCGRY